MRIQLFYNVRANARVVHKAYKRRSQFNVCNILCYISAHAAMHLLHPARVPAAGNIHLRRIALYINEYCAYNNNAQSYSLRIHQKLRLLYHIS